MVLNCVTRDARNKNTPINIFVEPLCHVTYVSLECHSISGGKVPIAEPDKRAGEI